MFSVKNGSLRAVVKFIFTIALFGWTIDSTLPFIHDFVLWVFGLQPATFKPQEDFLNRGGIMLAPKTNYRLVK